MKQRVESCKRCGSCCLSVALRVSPRKMEEYYDAWKKQKKGADHPLDIEIIYLMLEPLGYDKKVGRWRYSCKHFAERNGKGGCTIYKHRPKMCCDYGMPEAFEMGVMGSLNRRLYPDCVF